ncbi:hypothetical protein [Amaricoccus solimangrovi]|uniref:hypothetical protein n=1 Tax=Amaricoccus solimangrovi TaxID=2589815 RepID=UPI0015E42EE6|nr:hypothetical protein [Amaricoccus solimangrovi]
MSEKKSGPDLVRDARKARRAREDERESRRAQMDRARGEGEHDGSNIGGQDE